jgi:putative membrane protein
MYIDFLALMLINLVAAFSLLAIYVFFGMTDPDQQKWVPAFLVPGTIAVVTGFYMAFTWPLPGSYNIAYGGTSVLLGMLFMGGALALWKGWSLITPTIYAVFAGAAALEIGIRVIVLGLTTQPVLSGVGFILAGISGIFALPTVWLKHNRLWRFVGAAVLTATAVVWAIVGYGAYWGHLADFSKWVPFALR